MGHIIIIFDVKWHFNLNTFYSQQTFDVVCAEVIQYILILYTKWWQGKDSHDLYFRNKIESSFMGLKTQGSFMLNPNEAELLIIKITSLHNIICHI